MSNRRTVGELIVDAIKKGDAKACARAAWTLRMSGFRSPATFQFFKEEADKMGIHFGLGEFDTLLREADYL